MTTLYRVIKLRVDLQLLSKHVFKLSYTFKQSFQGNKWISQDNILNILYRVLRCGPSNF